MATSRYFSLTKWGPIGDRQFWLIRADADWHGTETYTGVDLRGNPRTTVTPGWLAVTVGLFGFCVCITYWPEGKS